MLSLPLYLWKEADGRRKLIVTSAKTPAIKVGFTKIESFRFESNREEQLNILESENGPEMTIK